MIEQYKHHGKKVFVRKALKGKHREHCLCFSCNKFTLDKREENCPIANLIYSLCVLENLVLPVWECPKFEEIKNVL